MMIFPYAGLVMMTPTRTPIIVMIANPLSVERSMSASGSMAISTVAAAIT